MSRPPLEAVTSVRSVTSPDPSENNNTTLITGGEGRARARDTGDGPDLLAGLHNGSWLNQQQFPALEWAVPGLVPEGMTLLVGPPKAGKSWVLLGWLLAIAAGGNALGQLKCSPKRTLNLALEDGDRRQQTRCRSLMRSEPIPGRYNYLTRFAAPGAIFGTIDQYLDRYDDVGMIALDTLGKVMPDARNGESSYSRDYRIGSALKETADSRPGLSLVCVHHDRKAMTDDFVESVSGTNGLAGAADTIIVLRRKRQSEEAVLLITGRDVNEAEYAIVLRDGMWQLDGRNLEAAARAAQQRHENADLGEQSRNILRYFEDKPNGCRAAELKEQFGSGAGVYLGRLTESGHLTKLERGLYKLTADPGPELPLDDEEAA